MHKNCGQHPVYCYSHCGVLLSVDRPTHKTQKIHVTRRAVGLFAEPGEPPLRRTAYKQNNGTMFMLRRGAPLGLLPLLLMLIAISTFVTLSTSYAANIITNNGHNNIRAHQKEVDVDVMPLPEGQKWAHGVCSHAQLQKALWNEDIDSIETDLVLGYHIDEKTGTAVLEEDVPVSAHPPRHRSDLSVAEFLDGVLMVRAGTKTGSDYVDSNNNVAMSDDASTPTVNIKLDMKELQVVRPVMELLLEKYPNPDGIADAESSNDEQHDDSSSAILAVQYIYLNADVIPGPGRREVPPIIDGDAFISTCASILHNNTRPNAALVRDVSFFSLGWHVTYLSAGAFGDNKYTETDVQNMVDLIRRYNLEDEHTSGGIVLAVNARLLYNDCSPFDSFLETSMPNSQLLVWTGTGELPIAQDSIDSIKAHFEKQGTLDRIGFDCKVSTTKIGAFWYGGRVGLKQVYFRLCNWLKQHVLVQVLLVCFSLTLLLQGFVIKRYSERISRVSKQFGRCVDALQYQPVSSVAPEKEVIHVYDQQSHEDFDFSEVREEDFDVEMTGNYYETTASSLSVVQ